MSMLRLSLVVASLTLVGIFCVAPADAQWQVGGGPGAKGGVDAVVDANLPAAAASADANGTGGAAGVRDPNRLRGSGPFVVDANYVSRGAVAVDPNLMRYWTDPNALSLKDAFGATDDEWPALLPKIQNIQKLQAQLRPRRSGGMGMGMVMWGVSAQPAEPSELDQAATALDKVLADKGASDGDLKSALQTYRQARAKVKTTLETAQKDLKELLTVRQEAIAKQMGYFD